jgi:hypothetical protein
VALRPDRASPNTQRRTTKANFDAERVEASLFFAGPAIGRDFGLGTEGRRRQIAIAGHFAALYKSLDPPAKDGHDRVSPRDSPRAGQITLEAAPALILFFVDPLGVVAYQARVIDNSIAVLTQFWHKTGPEKQLAVVLINQEALDTWRVDWPITYERTAGLIHALACAQAVGVFFDFTLSEKFNLAEGKNDLEAAVFDPRPAPAQTETLRRRSRCFSARPGTSRLRSR